jgi:hypothetical protein
MYYLLYLKVKIYQLLLNIICHGNHNVSGRVAYTSNSVDYQ